MKIPSITAIARAQAHGRMMERKYSGEYICCWYDALCGDFHYEEFTASGCTVCGNGVYEIPLHDTPEHIYDWLSFLLSGRDVRGV